MPKRIPSSEFITILTDHGFDFVSKRGSHAKYRDTKAASPPNSSTDMRYELIIYWSREDQAFLVEVPELPGCMAEGVTYEEAVGNAQSVITEWIETAEALGRPIPEPKGKLSYA